MRTKTLKELATTLGISIATVSRALAGHEEIALKTRKRVAAAAQEFGYVPNAAGRQLVSGRSGFVGFVLPIRGPNFVDYYVGEIVTGLGEGLVAHGYDLFIATVQPGQSELDVFKHVVDSGRADGIVVQRLSEADERINYLVARDFPFVAHGRLLDQEHRFSWHDSDGAAAFGEAFELLYGLGHRHFGLLSISDSMTIRPLREGGLDAAIAKRGDPSVRLDVVRAPRFDSASAIEAANSMLHSPDRPTAIFGLFDELALIVMEQATQAGLSIPGDLSVIGYDNISASGFVSPGLSTFETYSRDSAREIAEMLVTVIEGVPDEPVGRLIRPEFIGRGSHGPAPKKPGNTNPTTLGSKSQ